MIRALIAEVKGIGLPHFIQSGVANWEQIALNFGMTFANIDNFLAAGRRSEALGMINSVWTDSAQCLLRLTWPAMAYGAAAPWQSTPMDREGFFGQYATLMYPSASAAEVAEALENLNKSENISVSLGLPAVFLWGGEPAMQGFWKVRHRSLSEAEPYPVRIFFFARFGGLPPAPRQRHYNFYGALKCSDCRLDWKTYQPGR